MSMEWYDYEEYENVQNDTETGNEAEERAEEKTEQLAGEWTEGMSGRTEILGQELQEEEERQEKLEELQEERQHLERELRDAQNNLSHAQKALRELEEDKEAGFTGVDPAISNREYQVRVYTKEIEDIERDIRQIDGQIRQLQQ